MVFLLPYCKICFCSQERDGICAYCRDDLARCRRELPIDWLPSERDGGYRRTAIFNYENNLRRLVLRAKVRGDFVALSLLIDLFTHHPAVVELVEWSDVLMTAPSSLWGRVRGRIDVAHALTLAVSRHYRRPVVAAPWQLFWRVNKRARIKSSLREQEPFKGRWRRLLSRRWCRRWSRHIAGRRVLLIDDISTSGITLIETAGALQVAQPHETRMLVLAAPRP